MFSPSRFILLLIFIAIPLIEIAVLIKVGQLIGVLPTVMIVIGTAILGFAVLRQQSLGVLMRANDALAAGRTPIEPVIDGAFLLIASFLLISPGLVADAIGLVLLVPFLRRLIARAIIGKMVKSGNLHVMVFGERPPPDTADEPDSSRARSGDGVVIEGEFKRLDDNDSDPKSKT
ncbi:putative Phage T7 F exclusion suppressor FxsA [Candidatus Filomicrobium marinum]|uniref:UPF0716 protein FxsA n=2 Tax=Filomicrobium TaxID=119044 RepID=A0A1H0JB07_9HYPH|nr:MULTISPECIES: FxsA family protein [Filomicrobium]MCV0368482.1 FxsA family protein [Filomicrobium sp.]CFX09899.1 putative Phage T7 F exclusion suppressor FxsA [Candidatus Filomicrobium marinum]CPR17031.1 putative Phage T7 F exclusion suppressor FxsA [Candidatus Filomicrobium marinum]SDO40824.1 UPF0716 protein FxsA [Filomicrobium insigne]